MQFFTREEWSYIIMWACIRHLSGLKQKGWHAHGEAHALSYSVSVLPGCDTFLSVSLLLAPSLSFPTNTWRDLFTSTSVCLHYCTFCNLVPRRCNDWLDLVLCRVRRERRKQRVSWSKRAPQREKSVFQQTGSLRSFLYPDRHLHACICDNLFKSMHGSMEELLIWVQPHKFPFR